MKKILFVTTRNPFSKNYSGDRVRSSAIIKHLSKRNKVDLVYSDKLSNKYISGKAFKGKSFFFRYSIFLRIFYILKQLININPLQLGFFYSDGIKRFVKKNHNKYDVIIFHLLRSAQYLPKNFKGKKILEMTDLYSDNYEQTVKRISFFNPALYLYFIEKFLVKKYEKFCFSTFDKIVLATNKKNDNFKNILDKKNLVSIINGCTVQKNEFKFSKKNYKILFIGNINYLPNKIACFNFAKNILPKINNSFPKIRFYIIGEISLKDKLILNTFNNVSVKGPVSNLQSVIKNSVCGIANLDIATGIQNKILTYMSFGLPSVCSKKSSKDSFFFKKNKDLLVYDTENELVNSIINFITNKKLANKISNNAYSVIRKKYSWNLILSNYEKII